MQNVESKSIFVRFVSFAGTECCLFSISSFFLINHFLNLIYIYIFFFLNNVAFLVFFFVVLGSSKFHLSNEKDIWNIN